MTSKDLQTLCHKLSYVAKLLLKHNSDPDLCDKNNMPPLLIAASFNYSDIAKLLLEKNCDVNLSCKDKKTPLYIFRCANTSRRANAFRRSNARSRGESWSVSFLLFQVVSQLYSNNNLTTSR
jgi:ankyrin repeat protein